MFLEMFVKRKKNRSGTTSVVVAEKYKGFYKELITIGIGHSAEEVDKLVAEGKVWIAKEEKRRYPELDLFEEEKLLVKGRYMMLIVFFQMLPTFLLMDLI